MVLFTNLLFWVPLVFSSLIILWLFYLELRSQVSSKAAGRALTAVIIIYFLVIATKIIYLYFQFKKDEFGQFLLPPKSNYFYQVIWMMSSSYVWALMISLILVLILLLLRKVFSAKLVDRSDLYILVMTVFIVGAPSVLILILGSFFLMVFFMIGFSLRQKKINTRSRLTLSPFLLIVALVILILSNLPAGEAGFGFYQNFLRWLRLI